MSKIVRLLRLVLNTLNDVEVKGKDNLDRLLGCINALETALQNLEALDTATEVSNEEEVSHG